jgi:hypothetical protein
MGLSIALDTPLIPPSSQRKFDAEIVPIWRKSGTKELSFLRENAELRSLSRNRAEARTQYIPCLLSS